MLSSVLSLIILGCLTATSSATVPKPANATTTTSSSSTTTATSAPTVKSVAATFPQFGPEQSITGTLTFTPAVGGVGVVITSTGDAALHNFPAGQGPFLYHSYIPPIKS